MSARFALSCASCEWRCAYCLVLVLDIDDEEEDEEDNDVAGAVVVIVEYRDEGRLIFVGISFFSPFFFFFFPLESNICSRAIFVSQLGVLRSSGRKLKKNKRMDGWDT